MVSKKSLLALILVVSFVLTSSLVSAQLLLTNVISPNEIDEDTGSFDFTFDLQYIGNDTLTISFAGSDASPSSVSLSLSDTSLNGTINETQTITGTISNYADLGGQTITVNLHADNSMETAQESFQVSVNNVIGESLCEFGEVGTLEISDFNIDNFGTGDDDRWEPLDRVEIEVEIENTDNNEDVSDVEVELFIFDENGDDVTNDFDLEDETIDLGRIKEGDEEIALFEIPEVPADLEEGDYRIYVKAASDDEDEHCVSISDKLSDDNYEEIEFSREEDNAVVIRDDDLGMTTTATCGAKEVLVSFPIYNIGVDKEKEVLVNLFNDEIGIDENLLVSNLKSGKKKNVNFFIDVPLGLTKDSYKLFVANYYDYDDDEDELERTSYDQNSDDDLGENYYMNLDVIGCFPGADPAGDNGEDPTVSASLESDAKLNQELIVKARIRNNANEGAEFSFTLDSVSSWAEVVSINPSNIYIEGNDFAEVTIRLLPKEAGTHSFEITSISNGQIYPQPVSVTIPQEKSFFEDLTQNTTYWIIGITAILILILLLIIVRVSGRPKAHSTEKAEF